MINYKKYLLEREDLDVLECDSGFIAFKKIPDGLFISEHYILPEKRKMGIGHMLANAVFGMALKGNIETVFCQCDESANGFDVAKINIENFGFEKYDQVGTVHHYKMEVSKWAKQ